MATYDSADLLSKFNAHAGRPSFGDAITDTDKYQRLAVAQNEVLADIVARKPSPFYSKAAYSAYPTLTTTDNQIFTFGTDANGYAISPMGKCRIYPSLSAIPDAPWMPGIEYLDEGTQIRIPNNRTYAGTLYWRGVGNPPDITATVQPVLFPEASRLLIVYKAVSNFGGEGNSNVDLADRYEGKYADGLARFLLLWKTQFKGGGALSPLGDANTSPMAAGWQWFWAP